MHTSQMGVSTTTSHWSFGLFFAGTLRQGKVRTGELAFGHKVSKDHRFWAVFSSPTNSFGVEPSSTTPIFRKVSLLPRDPIHITFEGIRSPGNGKTYVNATRFGGDWTSQSFSDNMTGYLVIMLNHVLLHRSESRWLATPKKVAKSKGP